MKKILLVLVACTFFAVANTQSIKVLPPGNIIISSADKDSVSGHATSPYFKSLVFRVDNLTADSMVIWWVKEINSKPAIWQSTVCDTNICYLDGTDSAAFTLYANSNSPIYINFFPFNTEGCGDLDIYLYEEGDRANGVWIDFKACAYFTGIDENKELTLNVYPNPVQKTLYITAGNVKDLKQIKVYNILGSEIRSFNYRSITHTNVYDVSDLATGRYFVKFIGEDDSVLATKSFSKVK